MIELSEAMTLASQLNTETTGRTVELVKGPSYQHKFTWFYPDAAAYNKSLKGSKVRSTSAFGIFTEMDFDNNMKLSFHDGINVRLLDAEAKIPAKYQLLIRFCDGVMLVFTVVMYGGFACHSGEYDNPYYLKSKEAISPLTPDFDMDHFTALLNGVKQAISAKAFLATEQRIPGLGNGSLQDILLKCKIHPKRKIETLSMPEKENMFQAVKNTFEQMAEQGGRSTEKDLYGNPGGYQTILSKISLNKPCPYCGGQIEKQTYLGGAVYYCSNCQPFA